MTGEPLWISVFAFDQIVSDDAGRVFLFPSREAALAEGMRQWPTAEEYIDIDAMETVLFAERPTQEEAT